jgi:hypothetical protein
LLEFPFRRKDLAPCDTLTGDTLAPPARPTRSGLVQTQPHPSAPVETPAQTTARRSRDWAVLSIVLVLASMLLGYLAAVALQPLPPRANPDPYHLSLTATESFSDLQLQWNRQSPAIQWAQKGTLTVDDGAFHKSTELTAADLQGTRFSYHPITKHVCLRLDVFFNESTRLSETLEWTASR